jgi:hypothetical protein
VPLEKQQVVLTAEEIALRNKRKLEARAKRTGDPELLQSIFG